jgi:hypothetical protein
MVTPRKCLGRLLATALAFRMVACSSEEAAAPANHGGAGASDGGVGPASAEVAAAKATFDTTVRPLLRQYCAGCHADKVRPYHSSANIDVAYDEVMSFHLVDFTDAKKSRFYTRLAVDNHQCWGGDCAKSAQTMLDALTAWISAGASSASPAGPPRVSAPPVSVPKDVTASSPGTVFDASANSESATELKFTMASPPQGAVVFAINIETLDKYSYRLFAPKVYAPAGMKVVVKNLLFDVNDTPRLDGSYSNLDMTVDGVGSTTPVLLDPNTTMVLLMDQGPGADRIAPTFGTFAAQ